MKFGEFSLIKRILINIFLILYRYKGMKLLSNFLLDFLTDWNVII